MSVRAMSAVWDFACPAIVNKRTYRPNHKYVLIAYADHADHDGRNIYPAVETIAKKTGYDERTIQRLTRDLEAMGLLERDGVSAKGTNRWRLPLDVRGGDKLSPRQIDGGDIPSGDIPSGDIPSGDKLPPDLINLTPKNSTQDSKADSVWAACKARLCGDLPRASWETWVEPSQGWAWDGEVLLVAAHCDYAASWLAERLPPLLAGLGVQARFFVRANT